MVKDLNTDISSLVLLQVLFYFRSCLSRGKTGYPSLNFFVSFFPLFFIFFFHLFFSPPRLSSLLLPPFLILLIKRWIMWQMIHIFLVSFFSQDKNLLDEGVRSSQRFPTSFRDFTRNITSSSKGSGLDLRPSNLFFLFSWNTLLESPLDVLTWSLWRRLNKETASEGKSRIVLKFDNSDP